MKSITFIYPKKQHDDNIYRFTIKNVNVSIINAIRRIILTDIPTVIFRTSPYKKNDAIFHVNTSRLNNEILKQRLGCIPIHIVDHTMPLDELLVEIHKKNETNTIQYITTADFKIKNIKTNTYLAKTAIEHIFPKNTVTKDYILFARLRPKISEHIQGEELKIDAKMSIGTAKESGTHNVASTCSYQMTPDQQKQREAWSNEVEELTKNGTTKKDILEIQKNWNNHDAKRHYKENSFDFILETIGVFTNKELLLTACDIIIHKLNMNEFPLKESLSTIKNCYDLTLYNEDYTIGKVVEYILNTDYYYGEKSLTYVGFQKKHPHDTHSTIRMAFKLPTNKSAVIQLLTKVCQKGIAIYEDIKSKIK